MLKVDEEDVEGMEGDGLDEYSLIRLSPECFNDLPFSLHVAAIFLQRSLVHTVWFTEPSAGVSGEGADAKPCWLDCGVYLESLSDVIVSAGEGNVGEMECKLVAEVGCVEIVNEED